MMKSRNLTLKYSIHQAVYWSGYCGLYSFAATYLLAKGYSAATVGWILFFGNFISFLLQPILADFADKAQKNVIPKLMCLLSVASVGCILAVRFVSMSTAVFALLYLAAIFTLDMQQPLLNSLNVYYTVRTWKINYALARAVGGLAFAGASLALGYIMEGYSVDWMPVISAALIIASAVLSISYPKDESRLNSGVSAAESTSILKFFGKYGWYSASLAGILLLALIHAMSENYLIEILRPLGGDSSNVGIALFIATIVEAPATACFGYTYKKLGSRRILLIAGISFTVKMILFALARSITAVYLIQLLQVASYVMLSPVQMYYAQECTGTEDMVKGQSVITAAYTLGCAFGNLFGGIIISARGVGAMLLIAIALGAAGLLCIAVCVPKALKYHEV